MSAPTVSLALPDDSNAAFAAIVAAETWSETLIATVPTLDLGGVVKVFRNTSVVDGTTDTSYAINFDGTAITDWAFLSAEQIVQIAAAVLGDKRN